MIVHAADGTLADAADGAVTLELLAVSECDGRATRARVEVRDAPGAVGVGEAVRGEAVYAGVVLEEFALSAQAEAVGGAGRARLAFGRRRGDA